MIGTLISVIITLIIVGVIWWAIQQLLPMLPMPEQVRRVIYVLLVVVLVLIVVSVLLSLLGVGGFSLPVFHGRY